MLWSFVLPFFVTCGLLAAVVIVATVAARSRGRAFAWSSLLAILAFIPTFIIAFKSANAIRLGVGQYENYDVMWDVRFKRWLPEQATNIVSRNDVGGYEARFTIDRESLDDWFERCWANAREKAEPRTEPELDDSFDPAEIEQRFGELGDGGPRSEHWIKYEGPRRLNWAGATTWFNEESGVAYQQVGFW